MKWLNSDRPKAIDTRLRNKLRSRLRTALVRGKGTKTGSAVRDLGCSIETLKTYLQKQFSTGMSWNNFGRIPGIKCWEIDHVVPLSKFNLSNVEELKKAVHYTNLQPLWAEDNLRKSNKYVPTIRENSTSSCT